MPPKKTDGSPKKSDGSPKKKDGSPSKDKKSSPKKPSPKKSGSPKKEEINVQVDEAELFRPTSPPPPKLPPLKASYCNIRRQHWYVKADKPQAKIQENHIHPYFALITSWGDIWLSDPPNRRIIKFAFNPLNSDVYKLGDIILRGHPYHLVENLKTGRVFVLLKSPSIPKVSIIEVNADSSKVECKIIFPYTPPVADPELEKPLCIVDESPPIGMAVADDLLFVLRSPIQKLVVFNLLSNRLVDKSDIQFNGQHMHEPSCVRVTSSGGIAVKNGLMFITCGREPGVLIFRVRKYMCYSMVDRIVISLLGRVQEDRLMMPFGVAIDSLDMVLVTDYQWDYIRGYHLSSGKEKLSMGQWKTIEMRPHRPGHISISKNGIVCVVCHRHNEVLIYVDEIIFQWYHDTQFYMEDVYSLRTIVDRMAVPLPRMIWDKAALPDKVKEKPQSSK